MRFADARVQVAREGDERLETFIDAALAFAISWGDRRQADPDNIQASWPIQHGRMLSAASRLLGSYWRAMLWSRRSGLEDAFRSD